MPSARSRATMRPMRRDTLPGAAALAVVLLAAACAANSDRTFRGRVLAPGDPWEALRDDWAFERTPSARDLRSGLQQLEDLVEHAASRVLGQDVDLETPELATVVRVAAVEARRGLLEPVVVQIPAWLDPVGTFGVKYFVDRCGPERLRRVPPDVREEALIVCEAVEEYARGRAELGKTRALLGGLEGRLFARLGLSAQDVQRNARRYDASVWWRSAFTTPPSDGSRAQVVLGREMLAEEGAVPYFVYAHELYHALVFESDPAAPVAAGHEQRFGRLAESLDRTLLHELSAQVFAKWVVDELANSGAVTNLSAAPLEALPGRRESPRPFAADPWLRLARLYPSERQEERRSVGPGNPSPRAFPSQVRVAERYGYDAAASSLQLVQAEMEALGLTDFTTLLARHPQWPAAAPGDLRTP